MSTPQKLAIVAALEREIRPLLRDWPHRDQEYDGRTFRFYENAGAVAVCGGIGPEAARRAAQAVIALFSPQLILSAGFAGAANNAMNIGQILIPRHVINANDGSTIDTATGEGTLVTFASIASPEQKAKLAASFGAQAVDMEASAVAQAAEAHGVPFAAVKAISDAADFALPPMENFITPAGAFRTRHFAFFLALRPWLWPQAMRLARNSAKAAHTLSTHLKKMIESHSKEVAQPATIEVRR